MLFNCKLHPSDIKYVRDTSSGGGVSVSINWFKTRVSRRSKCRVNCPKFTRNSSMQAQGPWPSSGWKFCLHPACQRVQVAARIVIHSSSKEKEDLTLCAGGIPLWLGDPPKNHDIRRRYCRIADPSYLRHRRANS